MYFISLPIINSTVRPKLYVCAQLYHPGRCSHGCAHAFCKRLRSPILQALSRFSSWILISTCHDFSGNIRRTMVGSNFGLVSVDDIVPKLSGTISVGRHGPVVPMVYDHVGSSSGWTWTRIQRLFTTCMGKPVDSRFGYMVRKIQDW